MFEVVNKTGGYLNSNFREQVYIVITESSNVRITQSS